MQPGRRPGLQHRRDFLRAAAALWQAAVVRASEHGHLLEAAAKPAPYKYSFLDSSQRDTLCRLVARLIPADDRSSGALGAGVDRYVDFVLGHADPAIQDVWRRGLKRYGEAIAGKDSTEIDSYLEQQARNEFAPRSEDETFFVILKAVSTEGFYTSEEGIVHELGYKGMGFVLEFTGCTHASHEPPKDWRPILRQPEEA